MPSAAELIPRVVPEKSALTPAEIDATLEIAYVTIAADPRLDPAEIAAFQGVLERLRGSKVAPAELDRVLDEMYSRGERGSDDADERLRALAAKMRTPARELAYKVAYAMGVADMEASDEEFELDLQLVDALELSNDRAEELADEVMAVLNPPS